MHVVTVSTSRSEAEDRSGPVIRELAVEHGHTVAGHSLVADDPGAIGGLLDKLLADVTVEAIVLTGGTGVSARDCTPRVVRERLDRELRGFGELFRMLSYAEIDAAAFLSDAVGGIARGRPVFALPGSPKACKLAMEKLILPELSHIVAEVSKETPLPGTVVKAAPAPTPTPAPPAAGKKIGLEATEPVAPGPQEMVTQIPSPTERPPEEDIATGWRAGLRAIKGEVVRGSLGDVPESLERVAAVMDVLNAAGDRAVVRLPDGREYTAFGYPDLVRNASKVLLVRAGDPVAEVVALHRWPTRVGICVEGEGGIVPSADLDPGPVAEERTGHSFEGLGQLFAVEGASIYLLQGKKVAQFDGRELATGWPLASALGTLFLHWSQR